MPRFLRLLPLLLALPALVAAHPHSLAASGRAHSTGEVIGKQLLYGTLSGAAAGGAMMLGFAWATGCIDREENRRDDEDGSEGSLDECLLPMVTGAFASVMTSMVVSGMVVSFTGDALDRRGSMTWSIIGACLGGFAGGLALAHEAMPDYLASIGFLAGTQLGAIGLYHLTDDARATLSWPPATGGPGGRGAALRNLRPGVEITLARF